MSIALKNLTLILPSLGFLKVGFRLHFQKKKNYSNHESLLIPIPKAFL